MSIKDFDAYLRFCHSLFGVPESTQDFIGVPIAGARPKNPLGGSFTIIPKRQGGFEMFWTDYA